jgi:hypothetical protein
MTFDIDKAYEDHFTKVRLRGYLAACARAAAIEERTMQVTLDEVTAARLKAEECRDRANWLCEQADLVGRVLVSGDEAWMAEVAANLEACFG